MPCMKLALMLSIRHYESGPVNTGIVANVLLQHEHSYRRAAINFGANLGEDCQTSQDAMYLQERDQL